VSRPNVVASLFTAGELDCYRIDGYEDLTVEHGQFGAATCQITIRPDSRVGDIAIAAPVGTELYGYQLWVAENGANVFRGPILDIGLTTSGNTSRIALTAENHLQHALRRRCNWTSDLAKMTTSSQAPNQSAIDIIDDAMGGVAGPVTPSGYPGGVTRTSWGHACTYSAGVAVGAPSSVIVSEQSGGNVQDVIEDMCLRYDMCPALRRTAAATYVIDIEYDHAGADLTDTVVLSANRGSLTDFSWQIPYTLTTVGRAAGAGAGTTQTDTYTATGTAIYGVYEDQITDPDADATACTETATALVRASSPLIVVEGTGLPTTNYRFKDDYQWRDTILVQDGTFGRYAEQTVIGWALRAWNGGRAYRYEIAINERRTDPLRLMAGKTGLPFGRSAGGRYREKSG
jgi:hypothetical protein